MRCNAQTPAGPALPVFIYMGILRCLRSVVVVEPVVGVVAGSGAFQPDGDAETTGERGGDVECGFAEVAAGVGGDGIHHIAVDAVSAVCAHSHHEFVVGREVARVNCDRSVALDGRDEEIGIAGVRGMAACAGCVVVEPVVGVVAGSGAFQPDGNAETTGERGGDVESGFAEVAAGVGGDGIHHIAVDPVSAVCAHSHHEFVVRREVARVNCDRGVALDGRDVEVGVAGVRGMAACAGCVVVEPVVGVIAGIGAFQSDGDAETARERGGDVESGFAEVAAGVGGDGIHHIAVDAVSAVCAHSHHEFVVGGEVVGQYGHRFVRYNCFDGEVGVAVIVRDR